MFENPRGDRQARNVTTNVPGNSRSQIVFRRDIFRKLTLGVPVTFFKKRQTSDSWIMDDRTDTNSVAQNAFLEI